MNNKPNTFVVPVDMLHAEFEDTGSGTVRANMKDGYLEFMIKGDFVEIRCMGDNLPKITVQAVVSNAVNLFLMSGVER